MSGETTFAFQTGFKEFLGASRSTRMRLFPVHVQVVVFAICLAPILAGIFIGLVVSQMVEGDIDASLFILAGLLLGALAGQPVTAAINRWSIRRLGGVASRDDVASNLSIGGEGIHFTSQNVDCRVSWPGIDMIFVDRGYLYFVVGLSAYYVPARCFSSDEVRRATFDYAFARLTPEASRRSRR